LLEIDEMILLQPAQLGADLFGLELIIVGNYRELAHETFS